MNDSIINDYLNITKKNVEKFGENTILLMQVGAFFEIYGIKDKNERIYGSKIAEICAICQLNMPAKTNKYNNDTILMAGVRDYSLDKYLPKMTDAGYTVVVYSQEKEGTNVSRYLSGIYSPGTILTNESDKKFSLTGLCIRLTDKISRLKNLLSNGKNYVKGEGMEDTFIDIANYGIIGLLVGRDKWKK